MLTAEQLHLNGVAAINAGRVHQARSLLIRAMERATTPDLRSRIDASLAYVEAETGERSDAMGRCDRALARAEVTEETRGVVLSQRALLLMRAGRTTEALADFAGAIGALREAPRPLGRAHLNRGGVYLQQHELRLAESDFRAAVEQFRLAEDLVEAAKAEHNLGYVSMMLGDLVTALRHMDDARSVLAPLSPVSEAVCDQDRAEVLIAAGQVIRGRQALRDAARVYGSRRIHQSQGEAELTLARTLVYTDPAAALESARAARRRFARSGADAWRVRADGVALAAEVEQGRRGPGLVTRGEQLIDELLAQGLHWGAASVRLHVARVLVRRGDHAAARQQLAGIRVNGRAPLPVRLLARDVRAELAEAQGRRAVALSHLRTGLADLHSWQSSFGNLDLQTLSSGHGRKLAVRGIRLAVESGSPKVFFEWSERARMVASRVQPVRAPEDPELADALAELRRTTAAEDGPRVPTQRGRDDELRQGVRERAWRHRGTGEVTEPSSLDEVREALGQGTALVATLVTRDAIASLVVTDAGVRLHDIGPRGDVEKLLGGLAADLDMAAASGLPEALATSVRGHLADRLAALSGVLLGPLMADLGDRRVVLTPSGLLAGTPWTLLPALAGRPVTVAQSATAWLARGRTPLRTPSAGFVAGPRVERAEAEVTEASVAWPGAQVLTRAAATAEAVAQLAARVDVLHVAAHGRHSAENPMFSGLELADGPWFGYDIDQLPAVPDVVLLSACEGGRSTVRAGEELIGMTTAWLHAGTRCVVATPAAVNDEVAHAVLTATHAGLAQGLDPAEALARAVPPVTATAAPAPFTCYGRG
ncbi:CHAT domain-containing protein [Nocardioides sp.]|uniref:CHAT domain-containing protein n=1 Tax=Nocardioides sp. TaxID=35761 RepID=UPI002732FC2B|nr:CHAT domain-containing protein [Nocardioides sp.]MDP3893237.1 CHAT domain-containing protein [Nocardioides sp.]